MPHNVIMHDLFNIGFTRGVSIRETFFLKVKPNVKMKSWIKDRNKFLIDGDTFESSSSSSSLHAFKIVFIDKKAGFNSILKCLKGMP